MTVNLDAILRDERRNRDECMVETPYVLSYCRTSRRRMDLLSRIAGEFSIAIKLLKKAPGEYKNTYAVAFLNYGQIWMFEKQMESDDRFVSCIYHEIGHILCRRSKRYYEFHKGLLTREKFNRTALRVERYVDRVAKEMVARRHPSVKYLSDYDEFSDDPKPNSNVYMDDHGTEADRQFVNEQLEIDPTIRKPRGAKVVYPAL